LTASGEFLVYEAASEHILVALNSSRLVRNFSSGWISSFKDREIEKDLFAAPAELGAIP
jgi:hypothetical protein